MRIDFHSEKFKKTMVWIIALVILPAFLLGGGMLSGLFHGGGSSQIGEVKVTINDKKNDKKIDAEEYINFQGRFQQALKLIPQYYNEYASTIQNSQSRDPQQQAMVDKVLLADIRNAGRNPEARGIVMDKHRPMGLIINAYGSWIPTEKWAKMDWRNYDNEVSQKIIANLFVRYYYAKKYNLIPDEEEVNAKIDRWFQKPDYEINDWVVDEEGKQRFLNALYGGIPYDIAKKYFHQTVSELIAIDRLERFENPIHDAKLDKFDDRTLKLIQDKEQRKFDYFVIASDRYKPAAKMAYEKAAADPDLTKLEKLYETLVNPDNKDKGYIYQQPRSFSGSILLIDMAKVDEILRPDVEKNIKEPTDKAIEKHYNDHKEDYLIIPEKPTKPEPKPNTNSDTDEGEAENDNTDAAKKDAEKTTKKAPAPQYKPLKDVKKEIAAKLKKDAIDIAMAEARKNHLEKLDKDVNDYVAAQRHIDVDTAAKEAFKNASLGSMFNGLVKFGKTLTKAAVRTQKLPDLKPFADKHDEVTLTKTETYLNSETALTTKQIGGEAFSKLVGANYYEFKFYPFDTRLGSTQYLLTRVTDGTSKDNEDLKYKFIFRIEDIREPELLPFKELKKNAPATHEKLLKDYAEKSIAENAYADMLKDEALIIKQAKKPEGKFDFEKQAKENAEAIKTYNEWKKNKDKENDKDTTDPLDTTMPKIDDDKEKEEEPGFETTEYIDITGNFPRAYTQEALKQEAFALTGDQVAVIRTKLNKDNKYEAVILIRLHKDKDGIVKPIRHMSFKQFAKMMEEQWTPGSHISEELKRKRFEYFSSKITIIMPELTEEEPEDDENAEAEE